MVKNAVRFSEVLGGIERSLEGIEEDYGYMKNSIHELLFEENFRDYK